MRTLLGTSGSPGLGSSPRIQACSNTPTAPNQAVLDCRSRVHGRGERHLQGMNTQRRPPNWSWLQGLRLAGSCMQCEGHLCGSPPQLAAQRQAVNCALPSLLPAATQPHPATTNPCSQVGRDGAARKSGINRLLSAGSTGG